MNLVERAFNVLAAVRHARAFHPTGQVFDARLCVVGRGPLPEGEQDVVARLSKGAGLPSPVPDFLGLAFRAQSESGPVDVLCTTTAGLRGWRRMLLWPARQWTGAQLTTLMPWQHTGPGHRNVVVGVEVLDDDVRGLDPSGVAEHLPVRICLQVTEQHDRVLQSGELVLVAARDTTEVSFDPIRNHPAGWRLGPGWLAEIRESAYVGSRRGRPH
jgi:hypothetical protein